MSSSAGKMLRTISLLFIICCLSILVGCGGPKYPKADLEVTAAAVNRYTVSQLATYFQYKENNKKFDVPDLAEDYAGKIVRIKGQVYNRDKNKKTGKPIIVLERRHEKLASGYVVFTTIASFKNELSPQAEKKASNQEYVVIQGILKGRNLEPLKNDAICFWHIEDAIIIENDEFNVDGKADDVLKSYSKHLLY